MLLLFQFWNDEFRFAPLVALGDLTYSAPWREPLPVRRWGRSDGGVALMVGIIPREIDRPTVIGGTIKHGL
jgi:hypothetical protein